jgi:hypothetical protein
MALLNIKLTPCLQYNELAKLYGTGASTTPPMSLSSSPGRKKDETGTLTSVSDILSSQKDQASQDAAKHIRLAMCASQRLKPGLPQPSTSTVEGVKIWSGPSADAVPTVKSTMPSISESPMEQDFTIEGMPSNLGCPFASMNGKKLSSHAASVLSRYNPVGSAGGAPSSTPLSSVSRVNGRESFNSRRENQHVNIPDPIKAEICGLSNHADEEAPTDAPVPAKSAVGTHVQSNADPNVCPIRFLDQHSPEEVATYFEKHKHDLPRSHEICVKRYQSNESQIRELDARYGNLVSMIQGLGVKHQPMLPAEPPEEEADDEGGLDPEDAEKVRNWANSVSPQPQEEAIQVADCNLADNKPADDDDGEERQSRFARPLRPIELGESPSRPWGIKVPVKYQEKIAGTASETSSQPAEIPSSNIQGPPVEGPALNKDESRVEGKGRCPFGFDQTQKAGETDPTTPKKATAEGKTDPAPEHVGEKVAEGITFIAPETVGAADHKAEALPVSAHESSRMVFNGPVFIGYSAEDAAKILRESGLGRV